MTLICCRCVAGNRGVVVKESTEEVKVEIARVEDHLHLGCHEYQALLLVRRRLLEVVEAVTVQRD